MTCPNPKFECKSKSFTEPYKSDGKNNIDGLNHSHMRCHMCGYQFNHWNESIEKIKAVFGENYSIYK